MRDFIFYNKSDTTKEPIGKIHAIDLEAAQVIAAYKKQMKLDVFLTIFEVKEI